MFDGFLLSDVSHNIIIDHHALSAWELASGVLLLILVGKFMVSDLRRYFTKNRLAEGDVEEMTLVITGMTCSGCVHRIETALKQVEGVRDVSVDLKAGSATIWGEPKLSEVIDSVTRLGFRAINQPEGI